jgi:hypothetical protein
MASYLDPAMLTGEDPDWQASFDYAADQRRYAPWSDDADHTDDQPTRDPRTPCRNPDCDQLCVSLYCTETCRRVVEPSDEPPGPSGPLPDSPVSVTARLTIAGHADILFTLRGHDPDAVLAQLEAVLQRYPAPVSTPMPEQAHREGWCATHHVQMRFNPDTKGGKGWYSHKTAQGWCKGK